MVHRPIGYEALLRQLDPERRRQHEAVAADKSASFAASYQELLDAAEGSGE